jgi:hypothetical protein
MAANSEGPQVWLAGLDPISRSTKFPGSSSDYLDMFRPDAAWHRAAAGVQVFELGPRFVMEAPDSTLAQIFADLERRRIALAIGASWLRRRLRERRNPWRTFSEWEGQEYFDNAAMQRDGGANPPGAHRA